MVDIGPTGPMRSMRIRGLTDAAAELIVHNGRIFRSGPRGTPAGAPATAVAVSGGRILGVGMSATRANGPGRRRRCSTPPAGL